MAHKGMTVKQAIRWQQVDLRKWDKVLKPEIAVQLRSKAERGNSTAQTGEDVIRGPKLYETLALSLMK